MKARLTYPARKTLLSLKMFHWSKKNCVIKVTYIVLPVVVCGFEAFINGKHIVGEVKEKEQAHKEYREAISKGHGAYLMDEETPVGHVSFCLSHDPIGTHINSISVQQSTKNAPGQILQ